ncbi:DUF4283 domain protein, partial [Trifolium medium]|nr:DUF4283 domain protein [Trifolium medium]
DSLVDIKIIEEWGFNIGEDACVFVEEDPQEAKSEHAVEHGDHELSNHVDVLVEKITAELECDEGKLNEDADNHTGKKMAVEDFLHVHHKSDTETVVSP